MKTPDDAEALAHAMVRIGNNVGRNTMAIISDMSQPLGNAVGNSLELSYRNIKRKWTERSNRACVNTWFSNGCLS